MKKQLSRVDAAVSVTLSCVYVALLPRVFPGCPGHPFSALKFQSIVPAHAGCAPTAPSTAATAITPAILSLMGSFNIVSGRLT